MKCRIGDLQNKQVVCMADGAVLGYVGDIEIDTVTGKLTSIIIFGKSKIFGILGRDDDLVISFSEISVIGEDTILVDCETLSPIRKEYITREDK